MLSKINEVKNRIELRSQQSRSSYLREITEWRLKSPNRTTLGCSNLAHTYAACNNNKQSSNLDIKKFVGIITAYNDMLSAHAPFETYPSALKNE